MEGKEVYGRSFYGRWGIDFEGSWILQRGVEFWSGIVSVRHWGCWRFWAWGPGYPYDILELGSYLVGRVELGFGQCLHSAAAVNKASDKQAEG
jgi:hypothetical protein